MFVRNNIFILAFDLKYKGLNFFFCFKLDIFAPSFAEKLAV